VQGLSRNDYRDIIRVAKDLAESKETT